MARTPLEGVNVVEFAGLAPGPYAGQLLADFGATVIRIDRAQQKAAELVPKDVLCRGKRSISIDLKTIPGKEIAIKLVTKADVLIDPFRPGVLEALGLGPDVFLSEQNGLNKRLIYARLSGFTRSSRYKDMAGHDINYLALSGILAMLPGNDKPNFPLNLLADFAGGGLMCAMGILLALQSRNTTGKGQVVETDMVSGTRYVSSFALLHHLIPNSPTFGNGENKKNGRGTKLLDGGAPFYSVYKCKDGKYMSVGCIEAQFFKVFVDRFVEQLPAPLLGKWGGWRPTAVMRTDEGTWPIMRRFFEEGFLTKSRDEWANVFYGTDACTVPVLAPPEAAEVAGSPIPIPHPSLISTPARSIEDKEIRLLGNGENTLDILRELELSQEEIESLVRSGALGKYFSKL